ncbi:helix-turn-helix domain-containing protein [Streptomyces sp. NPDC007861]|uniref:helix-turn-helix domain-containing protein n=1 Tax=Streptomyces sp. NPDC007861 TaxID=3154893 RepID=UPI0033CD8293
MPPHFFRRGAKADPALADPSRRLLTTAEAAEVAQVSPACIRQWVRRGYLRPVARYGKRNLYREDHVLRAERDRRNPGGPPPGTGSARHATSPDWPTAER